MHVERTAGERRHGTRPRSIRRVHENAESPPHRWRAERRRAGAAISGSALWRSGGAGAIHSLVIDVACGLRIDPVMDGPRTGPCVGAVDTRPPTAQLRRRPDRAQRERWARSLRGCSAVRSTPPCACRACAPTRRSWPPPPPAHPSPCCRRSAPAACAARCSARNGVPRWRSPPAPLAMMAPSGSVRRRWSSRRAAGRSRR